jgi:pimeloyl-ACP methyl ester carboxylesterase
VDLPETQYVKSGDGYLAYQVCGDPVAISEMTSLERWKDETLVVLDAVGSRQATLVGYGGGSHLAMLFAATHPDRTRALVLLRAAARFTAAPDYPWGLAPERVPAYLDDIEHNWGTGAQFARALDLPSGATCRASSVPPTRVPTGCPGSGLHRRREQVRPARVQSARSVDVGPVFDAEHDDFACVGANSIQDAIGPATRGPDAGKLAA